MNECFGKKFILNGSQYPADQFSNAIVYEGDSIYEVLKMVKGNPVFFNDHMDRLTESVRIQNKRMLADGSSLRRDIINICKADKRKEVNLKIVFNYNNDRENYLVYFIEPIYPSFKQYEEGVKGTIVFAERKNPVSKMINHKLRSTIFQKLIHVGAYEALLVNSDGMITEGSRTNIFFSTGDSLITAPEGVILNGITRKHILEICKTNKIKVKLECVNVDKISEFKSVFMTGTSPMVLPFNNIDDKHFSVSDPIIKKLRHLYIEKAEESISEFNAGTF